jgi:hypothetical protein
MRKSSELAVKTEAILEVFRGMQYDQKMAFAELGDLVAFPVTSTTPAYRKALKTAERDHKIYVGAIRGYGFYRGGGEDMANSLYPMALGIKRASKRMISRADLAIENNLSQEKYQQTVEHRSRAAIIYSTSSAFMPASNRKRREPALEAESASSFPPLK